MSKPTAAEYMQQLEQAGAALVEGLTDLQDVELTYATESAKFYTVRRMLLLATTHTLEHVTQIEAARVAAGAAPSMPQRMLARVLDAHGQMLAALVGMDEAALDAVPAEGEWSVRETIEHTIEVQQRLLKNIQASRERAEVSENQ